MKISILAGGTGTRLWPRSRACLPKQFLDLVVPNQSLLQETVERIRPLVPVEDILVVTGRDCARRVARQLPDLPKENILAEPCGRGSAPAIGLAAITIMRRWGNDVMVSLHADHHIADSEILRRALTAASRVAQTGRLVTLGIVPTRPHTGLGYVRRGELLGTVDGFAAHAIARFVEKPDAATAQAYLESGEYYWNTGMFVWQAEAILGEIGAYMPELSKALTRIQAGLGTPQGKRILGQLWHRLRVEQIDYGVMERTQRGAVIPVDNMGWSDVGDWESVSEILASDDDGNTVVGAFEGIDTSRCIIVGSKRRLVATIGLQDMVVVVTDNAVLVCPRRRCQDVRKLVDRLRTAGRNEYL